MTHDEPGARPVRRRRPRLIDWRRGARLLAEGLPVAAVAAALHIDPEHVWRHLETSHRFRRYVRQALGQQPDSETPDSESVVQAKRP
ncbi:hypothetical protein [Ferrovibrio xuzhouensis]|uniref:Uncharacterized protein n=1 Tax=Ferrovibrio xuzhouensis TaxID=1576914 RepID=A0ABV7VIV9_9PROT